MMLGLVNTVETDKTFPIANRIDKTFPKCQIATSKGLPDLDVEKPTPAFPDEIPVVRRIF